MSETEQRKPGPNWPGVVALLGMLAISAACVLGALWIVLGSAVVTR